MEIPDPDHGGKETWPVLYVQYDYCDCDYLAYLALR